LWDGVSADKLAAFRYEDVTGQNTIRLCAIKKNGRLGRRFRMTMALDSGMLWLSPAFFPP
jgi:hypothetical protein